MNKNTSRIILYGLIAIAIQLPIFLLMASVLNDESSEAHHSYYVYEYWIGAFPWIHIYRTRIWDLYDLLPRNADKALEIAFDFFLFSLNWFLNGCLIGIVDAARKKIQNGFVRYAVLFTVSMALTYAVALSCFAIIFGFGDSIDPPTGKVLNFIGYSCSYILAAIMWPEDLLSRLIGIEAQGFLSLFIVALTITLPFVVHDSVKRQKR